ncbi:MAG: stage V sporulation protein AD [Clostridia bacterium]|nr:stage V sporulation protein AD [Clostridia bacterium]
MSQRIGRYTLQLSTPVITGFAGVAGKKEGEGPLGEYFDKVFEDTKLGQKSWEAAESALLTSAVTTAITKAGISSDKIDMIFVGDLLNQSIASTFGVKDLAVPHIGLFGACSTMALSLCLAGVFVDAGSADCAVAATSSHFCSTERQFRFPLEYGGKRTPTSQWTVTGSGAAVVEAKGDGVKINAVTFGKIMDYDIKDANNMGAAMAPAACDTLKRFFEDTDSRPEDYDLILTGDLGKVGADLLCQLLEREGYVLGENYNDCGLMIFDLKQQQVDAGGSGCGCSGAVLCSLILNEMLKGKYKKVLFVGTGALMSPTSTQQGQAIPAVAHLVMLTA